MLTSYCLINRLLLFLHVKYLQTKLLITFTCRYERFVKSRGGNFNNPYDRAGQKATLA